VKETEVNERQQDASQNKYSELFNTTWLVDKLLRFLFTLAMLS